MISRISLRIGDIKRSKMVRTINFYYNNRTVQAVQELKNKPGECSLQMGYFSSLIPTNVTAMQQGS